MAEGVSVRAATGEEHDQVVDLLDLVFHDRSTSAHRDRLRRELDRPRTRCAFVGDLMVGTSSAWGWPLTVPGGELACSAITIVAVRPTHRRRGIMRAMIAALLDDARDRGEPVAALWAAEGGIYGRFGFGPASFDRDVRVDLRREVRLRPVAEDGIEVRLLDATEAAAVVPAIYDRFRRGRPGVMGRVQRWWTDDVLGDAEDQRDRRGIKRVAVAGDEGYAVYTVREEQPDGERRIATVTELVATTARAERALLGFLTRIDLVAELVLLARPVDDELRWIVDDVRALETRREGDALWLRLLDVPAAMEGRSWACPVDLVLEVEQPDDPRIAGRWALRADERAVTCERTTAAPDLTLAARDLASVYLGGVSATALRDAGIAGERTAGAAASLDAGLRADRAPWTIGDF